MAKISAKGAVITLASVDVSKYVESYEIEWKNEMLDVTGFTDGWQNHVAGIPIRSFTINPYWDKTATTGIFAKIVALMTTAGTCSIVPEAGGPTMSGTFIAEGFTVGGPAQGDTIKMGGVKFFASGDTIATFA